MELYRSRLRRPRFTLAQVGAFIAALAMALRWPILLLPTFSIGLALCLTRVGFSLIWTLIIASIVGFILGLSLPAIVAH